MARSSGDVFRTGCAGVLLLALAAPVRADPVTITGGLVETNVGISAARFEMEGAEFFWSSGGSFSSPLAVLCSPCAPGTQAPLGGVFNQSNFGGRLITGGVTYDDLFFFGSGTFTTDAVVLAGPAPFTVQTPFRFTGLLRAFDDPNALNPLFTFDLAGVGTATASFGLTPGSDGTLFDLRGESLTYRFEPAGSEAPVPEPTSMVLLGTGVAGIVVRRWRAAHRREGTAG